METQCPLVVTGQQIGAGWTPALSVVKALAALAAARRLGGKAVFWLADEDHDREEVSRTFGLDGDRMLRHRFHFEAADGTATGWLPWGESQQFEASFLWEDIPEPKEPTLRGHFIALGMPLWNRGIHPFSPTDPAIRKSIQPQLERWRSLKLEDHLLRRAMQMEKDGEALVVDPRLQSAWFSLDPETGLRWPLASHESCAPGCGLSPGALLRPLMQSLVLPVTHVVLGPAERAYWRLTEPLWEKVDLAPPTILPRPTIFVVPKGVQLSPSHLDAVRHGYWEAFPFQLPAPLPTDTLAGLRPRPEWGAELVQRYLQTLSWTRRKLLKLDRRVHRDLAGQILGIEPERLRQRLFPLSKPQERVLPGIFWLRDDALLDRMLATLGEPGDVLLVEES